MKVAYVSGLCIRHDAISASVHDSISILSRDSRNEIRLYAYSCDFPDIPYQRVEGPGDILLDRFFQTADLVVFHFGVFNPLFNVIFLLGDRLPSIVWFHNITPKAFVAPPQHDLIDRSFAQICNMRWATHVVCDSETNLRVLRECGVETESSIIPLSVSGLAAPPISKPSHVDRRVRMVFIGRFVRSKGCDDLLDAAIAAARDAPGVELQLDIVGNSLFAEPGILARLRRLATSTGPEVPSNLAINLHESIDDRAKHALLKDADLFVLPTYHEGFCVTIVEAISFGCVVVAYANSNVPSICRGLGTLVDTGDIPALSRAIANRAREVTDAHWAAEGYVAYVRTCGDYTGQFSIERLATDVRRTVTRVANYRPSIGQRT